MRFLILSCACLVACTKPEPVQDPLDYLRVGVDPRQEASAVMEDLRAHGFQIGHVIDEREYVAFDASDGANSTVRVVTSRGPALSMQVPDVRWPERLWVGLGAGPRPDFSEVFRPRDEWGDFPCVIEIDVAGPRVLLEVSVPDAPTRDARVRVPIEERDGGWVIDRSPETNARWDREVEQRQRALEKAETIGDAAAAARLSAELDWLERLRKAEQPMLEPAEDGEEAR